MNAPIPRQSEPRSEITWDDSDQCHGRVIGYHEVHGEQNAPDDTVAMIETGDRQPDGSILASATYLTAEQAVDAALVLLDAAARGRANAAPDDAMPQGAVDASDYERRSRLHIHAASIEDMTFWIENTALGFKATEVETGVTGAEVSTGREALDNYWDGNLWPNSTVGESR